MIFSAKDVSLRHLGTTIARYEPRGIVTEVIQATVENIGAISLEFETELCYSNNGNSFIELYVARGDENQPKPDRYVTVRLGDWIVPLWGEIHVFHDREFINTFELDSTSKEIAETPGGFGIASGEVTGPNETQIVPAVNTEFKPSPTPHKEGHQLGTWVDTASQ